MDKALHARPKSAISDGVFNVSATIAQIVPPDQNREALIISPPTGADIIIGWSGAITATTGLKLRQTDLPLILTTSEHGALVQAPIYAVCVGNASGIWSASSWHNCLADQQREKNAT